jgi:hypothetical protein
MGQRASSRGRGRCLLRLAQNQLLHGNARQRVRLTLGPACNRKISAATVADLCITQTRAAGRATLRWIWGRHQFSM